MARDEEEDDRRYRVVVNDEDQYSIWFAERELPAGWRDEGFTGSKRECLDHVRTVWVDMRPRSLREQMAAWEREPPPALPPLDVTRPRDGRDPLVVRLSTAQPISASLRPERTAEVLQRQIDRGFVLVRFEETKTELGVRVDSAASRLNGADFAAAKGKVELVGDLVLNFNRVRFRGHLDLTTLAGEGALEFVEEAAPRGAHATG